MDKKTQRRNGIVTLLTEQPTLRISEIATALNVTRETIRRDFREMTDLGLIDRLYGGALLRQGPETNVDQRNDLLVEERKTIARLALARLEGAQTVMLGSGATTVHLARQIAIECKDMTVIVHSLGVIAALESNPSLTIVVAPGLFHPGERAMHGVITVEFLENYSADWCILGASGIGTEGASDALLEGSDVYRCMIRRSAQCMVLADASKFNRRFPSRYAPWSRVSTLVSDKMPDHELAGAVRASGTEIIASSM
jgi:DeoR/GlpR family transcriptional regulator of sugar metabolism